MLGEIQFFHSISKAVTELAMRKLKRYKPTRFMAKDFYYDSDSADFPGVRAEPLPYQGHMGGKAL